MKNNKNKQIENQSQEITERARSRKVDSTCKSDPRQPESPRAINGDGKLSSDNCLETANTSHNNECPPERPDNNICECGHHKDRHCQFLESKKDNLFCFDCNCEEYIPQKSPKIKSVQGEGGKLEENAVDGVTSSKGEIREKIALSSGVTDHLPNPSSVAKITKQMKSDYIIGEDGKFYWNISKGVSPLILKAIELTEKATAENFESERKQIIDQWEEFIKLNYISKNEIITKAKEYNGMINSVSDLFEHLDRVQKCYNCKKHFYDKKCLSCWSEIEKATAEKIFNEIEKKCNPLNIIQSDWRAYKEIKQTFLKEKQ